jgi:hypothetical protein
MEATRFNQFGNWQGEIRYAGKTVRIDPTRVFGTKDRSWGTRPVGDPAPPGAPSTELPAINFLWFPIHWKNRCTHAGMFENEHGVCWHWDGMVMPTYDSPAGIPGVEDPNMEALAGVDHEIHEFFPGTRRARRAQVSLKHLDGSLTEIELESLLVYRMKGIGYSHPTWGHGQWKGELAIGGDSWTIDECTNMDLPNQHIQSVVKATLSGPKGGEEGVGVMEQIHIGPSKRYGFKEFLDPAS